MREIFLVGLCFIGTFCYSQPNCNVYKDDPACYKACVMAIDAERFQHLRQGQLKFDSAIQMCDKLDYAYKEKSVPYLKVGNFMEWKKIIDKAIDINPSAHLGYRGWCRYQFVRDYEGAIEDFERLESLIGFNIGYSQNGDYHLNIARALCYKALGQKTRAIKMIEKQLAVSDYTPMVYDFLHLGVLLYETGDKDAAITNLLKSIHYNDYLAEPYYYLAQIYKDQGKEMLYRENIKKAKEYYTKGYRRFDFYTHPMDKIYLSDIDKELDFNN